MNTDLTAPLSQATAIDISSGIRTPFLSATRFLGAALAVLIMLALKRQYSLATADQLDWILAPTARLVAWLTPAQPVYEQGVGYVDFSQGIIIAPACAGVNFMIMAFGLTALCALVRIRRMPSLLTGLALALFAAYGYTLLVNAVRIAISMTLYKLDIYGGWLTMERLHRVAGIALYVAALWLFFMGLQTIMNRYCKRLPWFALNRRRPLPGWLPLGWYVAGAAGVPVANLLFQQRAPVLVEHCLTIGITVTCIATLIWAAKGAAAHLQQRLRNREKDCHVRQSIDCRG